MAESLGLKPGFRSDSLLSLASTVSSLDGKTRDLGVEFRPLTPATFADPSPIHPDWKLPMPEANSSA
jgi:hypothetical protein